jgi:hypothetical protein
VKLASELCAEQEALVYPDPNVTPIRLRLAGEPDINSAPTNEAPPPASEDDYGSVNIPDWMR